MCKCSNPAPFSIVVSTFIGGTFQPFRMFDGTRPAERKTKPSGRQSIWENRNSFSPRRQNFNLQDSFVDVVPLASPIDSFILHCEFRMTEWIPGIAGSRRIQAVEIFVGKFVPG